MDASKVKVEEKRLGQMEKRLGGLQSDFETTANTATGLFGFLGFGSSSGTSTAAPPPSSNKASGKASGASAASSSSSSSYRAEPTSMWQKIADKMLQVEAMLQNQEAAVDQQSYTVRKLKIQVLGKWGSGYDMEMVWL